MGLRFRKSISLGKFFRLNLSKSGVSLGVGPRGLNVNLGSRGIRKTVGLPGTGLYYQETSSWQQSTPADSSVSTGTANDTGSIGGVIFVGFIVFVVFVAILDRGSRDTTTPPKAEAQVTQSTAPKPDRPLNPNEIRELQTLLRKQGIDAGVPDGIVGPNTRKAAQAFGRAHHISVSNVPTLRLLESARTFQR